MDSQERRALTRELADTGWVLGHWYMACIPNARALADFSALSGMGQEMFGLVKGLFLRLDADADLQAREAADVASAPFLDVAPTSWADLVVTSICAESVLCADADLLLLDASDAEEAGLLRRLVEVSRFHRDYEIGWLDVLQRTEPDKVSDAWSMRGADAIAWTQARHPQPLESLDELAAAVPGGTSSYDRPVDDRGALRSHRKMPNGLHTFLKVKPITADSAQGA